MVTVGFAAPGGAGPTSAVTFCGPRAACGMRTVLVVEDELSPCRLRAVTVYECSAPGRASRSVRVVVGASTVHDLPSLRVRCIPG